MIDPKKKSAADIEALRWREMFQAAPFGIIAYEGYQPKVAECIASAATHMADLGLHEFYNRYEREK